VSGKYFSSSKVAKPSALANDSAIARRLWETSLEMTGLAVGVK
jgi:hypothetical protein